MSTKCMDCYYLELCEGAAVAKHKAQAMGLDLLLAGLYDALPDSYLCELKTLMDFGW